ASGRGQRESRRGEERGHGGLREHAAEGGGRGGDAIFVVHGSIPWLVRRPSRPGRGQNTNAASRCAGGALGAEVPCEASAVGGGGCAGRDRAGLTDTAGCRGGAPPGCRCTGRGWPGGCTGAFQSATGAAGAGTRAGSAVAAAEPWMRRWS